MTRWLRVASRLDHGRGSVLAELNHPAALPRAGHDCARAVPHEWQAASTLLPAIDRYGWASTLPLSPRSITTLMSHRQHTAALDDAEPDGTPPPPRVPHGWAWTRKTREELATALDDIDSQLDAALADSNGEISAFPFDRHALVLGAVLGAVFVVVLAAAYQPVMGVFGFSALGRLALVAGIWLAHGSSRPRRREPPR